MRPIRDLVLLVSGPCRPDRGGLPGADPTSQPCPPRPRDRTSRSLPSPRRSARHCRQPATGHQPQTQTPPHPETVVGLWPVRTLEQPGRSRPTPTPATSPGCCRQSWSRPPMAPPSLACTSRSPVGSAPTPMRWARPARSGWPSWTWPSPSARALAASGSSPGPGAPRGATRLGTSHAMGAWRPLRFRSRKRPLTRGGFSMP